MILSLMTGLLVGIIFSLIKLPIPAPNNIEGILGIIGIFLGMILVNLIKRYA